MTQVAVIITTVIANAVIGAIKEYIAARWVVHNIKKHGVPLDKPL